VLKLRFAKVAKEAAFCSAVRTALAGLTTPALVLVFAGSQVERAGPLLSTLRDRISNQGESVWPTVRLTELEDLAEKKEIPCQERRTKQSSVIFLMPRTHIPVPRSQTYTRRRISDAVSVCQKYR